MTLVAFVVWRRQGGSCGKRTASNKVPAANGTVSGSGADGGRHRYDNELSVKRGPDVSHAPPLMAATSESSSSSSSSTSFPPEIAAGVNGGVKNPGRGGSTRQLLIDKVEPSRRTRRQSHSCEVASLLRQPTAAVVDGGRAAGINVQQGQGQLQQQRLGLLPAAPIYRPSATLAFDTEGLHLDTPLRRSATLGLYDSSSSSTALTDPQHRLLVAPAADQLAGMRNGSAAAIQAFHSGNGRSPSTLSRGGGVKTSRDSRTPGTAAAATVDGDLLVRITRQVPVWHPIPHQSQLQLQQLQQLDLVAGQHQQYHQHQQLLA